MVFFLAKHILITHPTSWCFPLQVKYNIYSPHTKFYRPTHTHTRTGNVKYLISLYISLTQIVVCCFSLFIRTSPRLWIPFVSLIFKLFFHFQEQVPSFMAAVCPVPSRTIAALPSPSPLLLAVLLPPANGGDVNFLNFDGRLLFPWPPPAPLIRFP